MLKVTIVVVCGGFLSINLSLARAAHGAQELYDQETATVGRELRGAGLASAYHRVNAYYERHNGADSLLRELFAEPP